jgi:hypothetical protein
VLGCLRLTDRGLQEIFRPIMSRSHGLKFFSGKNFWREILFAGFFPTRKLKIAKNFGLKVKNSKKSWRESWKKRC